MIYLTCPYSHPDKDVRRERFNSVNIIAARLMCQGMLIFSTITHSHSLVKAGGLPLDWELWKAYETEILRFCEKVIVLKLDGWEESKRVSELIAIAKAMGTPVEFMDPDFS